MGNLIDLNSQIPDSRIPDGIARDSETLAAINAHVGSNDPHPIYLTQIEGDARYRQTTAALTDADIPSAIARDTEYIAADAAHVAAANPHPGMITAVTLDNNVTIVKQKLLTGTTPATPGHSLSMPLGINPSLLLGFSCMVGIDQGGGNLIWSVPPGIPFPGYAFSASIFADIFRVRPDLTNSGNILNRPFKALIYYIG